MVIQKMRSSFKTSLLIIVAIMLFLPIQLISQGKGEKFADMLHHLLKHTVNEVSVEQAVSMQDVAIFWDSRTLREYEVSHIQDAVHVGFEDFQVSKLAKIPKKSKIIVYCSVGYRSEIIAEKLVQNGFEDVSNLVGGIFEWKNKGNKVYNNWGETEDVHVYSKLWSIWLNRGEKVYE